jgi:hypothetical protein
VNPFVSWVWIGVLVLMSGALVSLWPEVALREVSVWGYARLAAGGATSVLLAILMATSTARAAPDLGLASEARPHTLASLVTPRPFDATPAIALACGAVIATLSSRGRGRARRNDRSRRA